MKRIDLTLDKAPRYIDPVSSLFRLAFFGGGSKGTPTTVEGAGYVELIDALRKDLLSLKEYGKCLLKGNPFVGQPVPAYTGSGTITQQEIEANGFYYGHNYLGDLYALCSAPGSVVYVFNYNGRACFVSDMGASIPYPTVCLSATGYPYGKVDIALGDNAGGYSGKDWDSNLAYTTVLSSWLGLDTTPIPTFQSMREGFDAVRAAIDGTLAPVVVTNPTPTNPCEIWCNNGRIMLGNCISSTPDGQGTFVTPSELTTNRIYKAFPTTLVVGRSYTVTVTGANWSIIVQKKKLDGTDKTNVSAWVTTYDFTPEDGYIYGIAIRTGGGTADITPADFDGTLTLDTTDGKPWADGTPETLTVSGNIVEFNETRINSTTWAAADKSHGFEVCADVYSKSVGNDLFSNANCFGAFVPCTVGESISIEFFDYSPDKSRCYYCEVTADGKVNTAPTAYADSSQITQKTFTLTESDSIGFVIEWYINSSQVRNYTKENYAVCYGTTPLAAYQPYTPIQSVTNIPNKLGVGDYKDTYEFVSGLLTHKVGVMVLDGTEDWGSSISTKFYLDNAVMRNYNNMPVLCSHYEAVPAAGSGGVSDNQVGLFASGSQGTSNARLVICDPRYTTRQDFKAFLAAQYAAGTPVIVVYPLAEPTTESINPTTIPLSIGTNEITAVTCVDPVDLEAVYIKAN